MENLLKKMNEAAEYIVKVSNNFRPEVGLILGSGLGEMAGEINNPIIIPYKDIPHMKTSTVEGHEGNMILGMLEGKKVMAFKGRIHYYEGYTMREITFPVRIMQAIGCKYMAITNASGGIREGMKPGDLMVISDHINLFGDNPLIGENDERIGVRFPGMSNAYDFELKNIALKACKSVNIEPMEGVYCGVTGPNYETYAEIRYLQTIGVDAVGMSTVPEVIVASHAGIRVVGISCITDVVTMPGVTVCHEEVLNVAENSKPKFKMLMREIIKNLS